QILVPAGLVDGPSGGTGGADDTATEARLSQAEQELQRFAHDLVGPRGRARVVVDDDPAAAILDAVAQERVDAVVVGNLGMSGRKQFLLSNIPNRISHNARCTVIIVNTAHLEDGSEVVDYRIRPPAEGTDAAEDGLLARAWHIGRVMA